MNRTLSFEPRVPFRKFSDGSKRALIAFLKNGHTEQRGTDMLAGQQSITYSGGPDSSGVLVPTEFFQNIILGMRWYDPLFHDQVVNLISGEKNLRLRPMAIPGWDLSEVAAELVSEGAQQVPMTVPTAAGLVLNGWQFKATFDASFELEEDSFEPLINQLQKAFSIAFARGIGQYLINGEGFDSSQPMGALTAAANSGVTISDASATAMIQSLTAIYFSVDESYRRSLQSFWVMADETYEDIRNTLQNQLSFFNSDTRTLLGIPVLISPSMPVPNVSTESKSILFGDFSHYNVRVSELRLRRSINAPGYAEAGKALYTGIMRADAGLLDPTGGVTPPIVYATY